MLIFYMRIKQAAGSSGGPVRRNSAWSCKGSRLFRFGRQAVENGLRFLFSVVFIFVYQQVFGAENTLPGVAVSVALTMYPTMDLGVRPLTMAGTIAGLFVAAGPVAQLALASPWLALPCNLLFVLLIMLLTCEPEPFKPSVCFLPVSYTHLDVYKRQEPDSGRSDRHRRCPRPRRCRWWYRSRCCCPPCWCAMSPRDNSR